MLNDIDRIKEVVDDLKKGFLDKYDFTVFDISVRAMSDADGYTFSGETLTGRQLNILKQRVNALKIDQPVRFDINVLTDPANITRDTLCGQVVDGTLDVTADISGKKLSTQISHCDEPFVIIKRVNDKVLVLLSDLTLGWIDQSAVRIIDTPAIDCWRQLTSLIKGETLEVGSFLPLFYEAAEFIDKVTYLHGGRSEKGIDCSALMQLLFLRAYGITTPRHTLDQMKCGVRAPKPDIAAGDLVFARRNGTKIMHVGLAFFDESLKVIHACLREKLVIKEDAGSFFEHYIFAGARRVIRERA